MGFGHLPELLIIMVIGLIVFGPEKLPEVAANVGKMVREVRSVMDAALHPDDITPPDDFASYYYESLARSGETVPDGVEDSDYDAIYSEIPPHSEEGMYEPLSAAEPSIEDLHPEEHDALGMPEDGA